MDSDWVAKRLQKGKALLDSGKAAKASPYFQQILNHHPQHTEAHLLLGAALRRAGADNISVNVLEKARELFPDNQEIAAELALALQTRVSKGYAADSIPRIRKVLQSFPDDPLLLRVLGQALSKEKRNEEAFRAFLRAAAIYEEKGGPVAAILGEVAMEAARTGRYPEALVSFEKALEADPGHFDNKKEQRKVWEDLLSSLRTSPE